MESMRHVLWIGGPAGSGKTTVARRIARRRGLRWYNADAHTWEHRDRAIREGHAGAIRWEAMSPYERHVDTTPAEMMEVSIDFDRWPMIADDVRRLPSPLVVAEGSTVSPELVATGIADTSRSVWLAPTTEFQRARFEERHGSPPDDPHTRRARENLLGYSRLIAAEIERLASERGANVLAVDASQRIDDTVAAVEQLFASALAEGPRAETVAERRELLRYANEAVVSQVRAYLARPWTTGDAETFMRDFVCECDDPECDTLVELPVAAYSRAADAGPVRAEGH